MAGGVTSFNNSLERVKGMDTNNAGRSNSEPKDINIILAEIMADLKARKGGHIKNDQQRKGN